jgi:uncharacterized protein
MYIITFSDEDQHYVYSAWTNQIVRIGTQLHNLFSDESSKEDSRQIAEVLGLAPSRPFFLEILSDASITKALADLRQNGPEHLVLSVTESCNFRCRYCIYSGIYDDARHHSKTDMSEETAIKAVRWYLHFPRQHYHIGFYGGEPLLRRRLIEMVISNAKDYIPSMANLSFGITSNGWFLDSSSIRFLAENHMDLFVSLDGPASVHDRYRLTSRGAPTFDRVWEGIKRIRREQPDYFDRHVNFSMTLAPPYQVDEIAIFFHSNPEIFAGKVPRIGTMNRLHPNEADSAGFSFSEEGVDLSRVRLNYLETLIKGGMPNGFSRACSEAAMRRINGRNMVNLDVLKTNAGQCTPGSRCHVTPDGRLHMCEHGNEHWPIGHVDSGFDYAGIWDMLVKFREFIESHCQDCWAIRLCSRCIPKLAEGVTLSPREFARFCGASQKRLKQDLVDYCHARNRNERCFDSFAYKHGEAEMFK